MHNLFARPKDFKSEIPESRFERLNLTENPFPSEPAINKESTDRRINGSIYELAIRQSEYTQIANSFLKQPQSDLNHLRLGYIIDTSYIGRGNGKSAFLVNLQDMINAHYCLDISEMRNKCFAIYVRPNPGGRTKTFPKFVDIMFESIYSQGMINYCLALLRYEAIMAIYPDTKAFETISDEADLVARLNFVDWLKDNGFDEVQVDKKALQNDMLQDIPPDFPFSMPLQSSLFPRYVTEKDFMEYYKSMRNAEEKIDFVFSQLIKLFIAAGFNGAYVLVDDFERIPDFQSARQKRDFAVELRSCLFDGFYVNARIGFYNMLLVLHAGVPRLISDAWAESGMENRSPILPQTQAKHIIPFERLSQEYGSLLIKKYLSEFRIDKTRTSELYPFTQLAVSKIGELSEYNAGKMLKTAYDLLDRFAYSEDSGEIDESFVMANRDSQSNLDGAGLPTITSVDTIDLTTKAGEE